MYVGSGDAIINMLMGAKANCLNCGKEMVFKEAGTRAKDLGITDNVLMCGHCGHLFTCTLVPGKLTLNSDVTSQYPQAKAAAKPAEKPAAKPAPEPERRPEPKPAEKPDPKKGFFAKLFGK